MEPKLNNMPEIKLEIKLEQSSVVAFITKAIEQLRYFKNKSNPTYSAYLVTIKIFPRYKKLNLYKKLKPYIEKRKEIKLLGSESFVKKK